MTGLDISLLAVVGVLLVLAIVLAVAETSLTRISRIKAMGLADEGRRGAGVLNKLLEHPERFLNTILLMVLIVQTVQTSLATIVGVNLLGAAKGAAAAVFFNVVVTYIVAEAAPKTWALQHTERAALATAPLVRALVAFPPLSLLTRLFIGLSNVITPGKGIKQGPFVSEEELLATVDVATEDEVIEREERALIRSIIEFGDTIVREVRVPRPDMVAVEGRDKVSDVIEVAISAGYSRIPVYDQGIDDITGVIFTKDLMRSAQDHGDMAVRELARPAQFVPETKRVAELMREMQKEKFHMAIVVDEYGGTSGLVTLEDLIEELVGEIVDEFDVEEPTIEKLPGNAFRVNARMAIDEVNELVQAEFPEGDWDTIGGFVFNALGHVPTEGETVEYDGHRLTAEKVQGRRIGRIRITKLSPATTGVTRMRSGFATLVGRPNVGKSTLLNQILGTKVSIVSDKPQTTRTQVRGVLSRPDLQVVFVDTPGIHKPRTLLGERLNDTAADALEDVDVVVFVVDATAPVGKGDRFVAARVPSAALVVVNKVDVAGPEQVLRQLAAAGELDKAEYFPVSALTGEGVPALVDAISERMPEGPQLYPDDMVTDVPEAFWVAELVREQLLAVTREELPHSVATRVTEWEWPRIRCEILVERDSQKGIVIGKGGSVLKAVGQAVREQLVPGAYLELFVKVDKDWQRRPKALERLGY